MKTVICAGPATTGKTSVLRHTIRAMLKAGKRPAYLKIDVQYADEEKIIGKEFGIPVKTVYSGELCPDHCNVMVLGDALVWAEEAGSDCLMVETAGLCLRCSPISRFAGGGCSGGHKRYEPTRKIGPMLSLADVAVVTKVDLISQAEREVFRAHSGKRQRDPYPGGRRPLRHRSRPASKDDRRVQTLTAPPLPAGQPQWGRVRSASVRRRLGGNSTSVSSAPWRVRPSTGVSEERPLRAPFTPSELGH